MSAVFGDCLYDACVVAAFREEMRTANVIANDPEGVYCLCLDRE